MFKIANKMFGIDLGFRQHLSSFLGFHGRHSSRTAALDYAHVMAGALLFLR